MALKVKDLMYLDSFKSMKLIAGKDGLKRKVMSVGIADYEFANYIDTHDRETFEPNMFVLSTLLFAHDNTNLIWNAVNYLYDKGASGFAYKNTVFKDLPTEVIEFANINDFPIFEFGSDLYMESIVFDVLDAIKFEEKDILSEKNIENILYNRTSIHDWPVEYRISFNFKKYMQIFYIEENNQLSSRDLERNLKQLKLNRSLSKKAFVFKYKDGLFLILTSDKNDCITFELILNEILDFFTTDKKEIKVHGSEIRFSSINFSNCIRQSYYTCLASLAENKHYADYKDIGIYKLLLNNMDYLNMGHFSTPLMKTLITKPEYLETITIWIQNDGDMKATAASMQCHYTSIKYRINKSKELLSYSNFSDTEFYNVISTAVRIHALNALTI